MRGPLQGCWWTNMGTTWHVSARIYRFSVGDEAHKRVSAGLSETEDDASEAQAEASGFIPRHRRESRQFNACPFDASQQTALMCSRLTRWPRRRRRILSRCTRGQSDDGSRHLRSRYWQEAAVSGHKITVTLLLKPYVCSETAIVPRLLSFWVHRVVKERCKDAASLCSPKRAIAQG